MTWDQIDVEKNLILLDRPFDSNMKQTTLRKERYWRTFPINSSLHNLIHSNFKPVKFHALRPNSIHFGNNLKDSFFPEAMDTCIGGELPPQSFIG
jgi:hypothetical protein